MPSLTQLFGLTLLAAACLAVPSSSTGLHRRCSGATLDFNNTITVDGFDIEYTSYSCMAPSISRRGLFDRPPLCHIFNSCREPPPPAPKSVCGDACTTTCNNNTGVLPPISQDCQTIVNSIQIFQESQSDIFNVTANHMETLTFGTCSFFFENLGSTTLDYCFSSLSIEASAAGAACFPPVQPFSSEGLCTASDGTWAAGARHS